MASKQPNDYQCKPGAPRVIQAIRVNDIKKISIKQGKIIDYLGMTFDFTCNPKLSVTMGH